MVILFKRCDINKSVQHEMSGETGLVPSNVLQYPSRKMGWIMGGALVSFDEKCECLKYFFDKCWGGGGGGGILWLKGIYYRQRTEAGWIYVYIA